MAEQDNEDYRSRVSKAVTQAVIEAGRSHPGDPDTTLNIDAALDGICSAMATLAATVAALPEDREKGAAMLTRIEGELVSRLRFFAEKVRSGELSGTPPERPKPRLVK